jgi:hypothetical protein
LKTIIKRAVKIITKRTQHTELTLDEQKKKEMNINLIIADLQAAAVSVLTLNEEAEDIALLLIEKAKELQDDTEYKPINKQEFSSFKDICEKAKQNRQMIQEKSVSISSYYQDLSSRVKIYKQFSENYLHDMSKVIYGIYRILRQ